MSAKIHTHTPTFNVRDLPVYGDVILSPMDGFSDWPFRSLCRQFGSAMSYTEFVYAADILNQPEFVQKKLEYTDDERPVVFQIYGDSTTQLLEAALRVQEQGPDVIDINMGCPSKSVANRGAGVGLMRTPLKVARIFRTLTQHLGVPVTGKIRLGWDEDCLTYPLIARIIEENGGAMLAVHGRTKKQGYGGTANWDAIAEIAQNVSIPVIGNGDVKRAGDIRRMKDYTSVKAVMVGRAAVNNPWIFAGLEREDVPQEMVRETVLTHLERNLSFYGSPKGLVLFRKYAARYLTPYRLPKEMRQELFTREKPEEFVALLEGIV